MSEPLKTTPVSEVIVLGRGKCGPADRSGFAPSGAGVEGDHRAQSGSGRDRRGEGTTAAFPRFLFEQLGLSPQGFYEMAQPTWKLGLKFLWGPRPEFFYTFETELAAMSPELPRPRGFYCEPEGPLPATGRVSALMKAGRVFYRQPNGAPDLTVNHAYHIENRKLVSWLEATAQALGITIVDGLVEGAVTGPEGIESLKLDGDRQLRAGLFVDCSGFRGRTGRQSAGGAV